MRIERPVMYQRRRWPWRFITTAALCIVFVGWEVQAANRSGLDPLRFALGLPFYAYGQAGQWIRAPFILPQIARLERDNGELRQQNATLREALASGPIVDQTQAFMHAHPNSILAHRVGFEPENVTRTLMIDRGSNDGVMRGQGVVSPAGVVGKIIDVTPFTSRVLLLTDYASAIPVLVQQGRYWGLARGTLTRIQVQYLAQDAPLHVGQLIITGRGHSFGTGIPVGRIRAVIRSDGALSQTATLDPAVSLEQLEEMVVLRQPE